MPHDGEGLGEFGSVGHAEVSEAKAPAELGAEFEEFEVKVGSDGEVESVVDGLKLEEAVVDDFGLASEVVGGVQGAEYKPTMVADSFGFPFEFNGQPHER